MAQEDFFAKVTKHCFKMLVDNVSNFCLLPDWERCQNQTSLDDCPRKWFKTNGPFCPKWICNPPAQTTTATAPINNESESTLMSNSSDKSDLVLTVSLPIVAVVIFGLIFMTMIRWRRQRADRIPTDAGRVEVSVAIPMEPILGAAGLDQSYSEARTARTPCRTYKVDDEVEFNYFQPPSYSEAMASALPSADAVNECRYKEIRRQQMLTQRERARANWTPFRQPLRTFSPGLQNTSSRL